MKTDESVASPAPQADAHQQAQTALLRILAGLPRIVVAFWSTLAEAYLLLTKSEQAQILQLLRKKIESLGADAQTRVHKHLQQLPASLQHSDLVSALWAQLAPVTVTPEPPASEPPED